MGGHAVDRGTERYAEAAGLGATLAAQGLVVATGGGPGAMEAANLGAFAGDEDLVAQATERLRAVPSFRPSVDAWASVALDVRDEVARADRAAQVRSIGIPTWFYGHEPPNVFCDGIAKYFSNAIREDGLLTRATAGLVVLEGAAGTVQEIFQAVTPLFYAGDTAVLPPLVLVGQAAWNERVPVWPALQALAGVGEGRRGIPGQDGYGESEGHGLRSSLHLVDTVKEAADVVVSTHRARTGGSRATR
jgi:predicted Rossmann-fold nucleotide-binding protein